MKFKTVIGRSAPTFLTILSIGGLIGTAVVVAKETPKAMRLREELRRSTKETLKREPTTSEYVVTTIRAYGPAIVLGGATIGCILGINVLNRRQQRVLTSAYILLEQSYKEYKRKIEEMYGKDAACSVEREIAKDHYNYGVEVTDGYDMLLFYEEHQGYFERTMLEVREAEYQLNRKFQKEGEASLNDWFELLNLPETSEGSILGWSQEEIYENHRYFWIEFEHLLTKLEDGMECYIIHMPCEPRAVIYPF